MPYILGCPPTFSLHRLFEFSTLFSKFYIKFFYECVFLYEQPFWGQFCSFFKVNKKKRFPYTYPILDSPVPRKPTYLLRLGRQWKRKQRYFFTLSWQKDPAWRNQVAVVDIRVQKCHDCMTVMNTPNPWSSAILFFVENENKLILCGI